MKLRRIALTAAGSALVAAMAVPPAGAAPAATGTDAYAAEATADALRVNVFGQQLTIGSASADVTSPDAASARGSGAAFGDQAFGASEASATGVGTSDGSATPSCSPLVLPPEVPVLDISAGCSTAEAAVTADGSSSLATATGLHLGLGGDPLVQPVVDALPIATLTDALIEGLAPLLGPVDEELPVPTEVVVDQLTGVLQDALTGDGVSLLTVDAGDVESSTSSDADSVDASTVSVGATVKILDRGGDGFGTQPILTIEAGGSSTAVSRDRASGETTAEQSAAPVRVTVADDVALLLQLPQKSFEVPEGQQVDLPLPPPLASSITLSSGSTSELENGAQAEAASVELNLLSGLNGGVQLGLATGSSSVVGEVATVEGGTATTAPPAPVAPAPAVSPARTTLPRTGTEEQPLKQIALVLGLSALGLGCLVVRSTRRSRASSKA